MNFIDDREMEKLMKWCGVKGDHFDLRAEVE